MLMAAAIVAEVLPGPQSEDTARPPDNDMAALNVEFRFDHQGDEWSFRTADPMSGC
jgi:hypothetical protein